MATTFDRCINGIVITSVVALFVAVAADFVLYGRRGGEKTGHRSIVATGSMVGFFIAYCWVHHSGLRNLTWISRAGATPIILAGTVMVVAGAVVNIWGRIVLRHNWANHIKIYEDHQLVSSGPYRLVRHPLYASIILMFIGGSAVHRNWLSLLLTLFVFTPFMAYRARQEEALLEPGLPGYAEYKRTTGMLFPRLRRQ